MFDTDNSGTLDEEEIMYFIAAFADGFARLIIKVRTFTLLKRIRVVGKGIPMEILSSLQIS